MHLNYFLVAVRAASRWSSGFSLGALSWSQLWFSFLLRLLFTDLRDSTFTLQGVLSFPVEFHLDQQFTPLLSFLIVVGHPFIVQHLAFINHPYWVIKGSLDSLKLIHHLLIASNLLLNFRHYTIAPLNFECTIVVLHLVIVRKVLLLQPSHLTQSDARFTGYSIILRFAWRILQFILDQIASLGCFLLLFAVNRTVSVYSHHPDH